jgi:AhpD family alkylhydroperoxidase
MALGIAVAKRRDGCIACHDKAAALEGATLEQVAEALSVALLMDGDTETIYGSRTRAVLEETAPRVGTRRLTGISQGTRG